MRGSAKSGYLKTLDGWRAIAITAVLFDHAVAYSPLGRYPRLAAVAHIGPNGVSLFFAISGFLICSRLLEEQADWGNINLTGFYIRRACRILPPAMLYLIAIGILSLFGTITVTWAEWWSSVFFFRNYLPGSAISGGSGGYTIHYWSLAVEEHSYLLWPAALVFFGKRKARWFALLLAASIAVWRTWDLHHHWFDRLIPGLLFGGRTDVRLDALLLGCLAALLLDNDATRTQFSERFKPWMWWVLAARVRCYTTHLLFSEGQDVFHFRICAATGDCCRDGVWGEQAGQRHSGSAADEVDWAPLLQSLSVAATFLVATGELEFLGPPAFSAGHCHDFPLCLVKLPLCGTPIY